MRLPQNTSFFEFSKMIPTFERYPLRSIMQFTRLIHYNRIRFFHTLSQIESRAEFNKTSKVQISYAGPVVGNLTRYPNAKDDEDPFKPPFPPVDFKGACHSRVTVCRAHGLIKGSPRYVTGWRSKGPNNIFQEEIAPGFLL